MEEVELKEATNQEPVFCEPRKWMIPRTCFIVLSLGKTYLPIQLAGVRKKINMWSKRRDKYIVDVTQSKTYGPEILILNETLLEKRAKRKLKMAMVCSEITA
jgi:hypothetical protein